MRPPFRHQSLATLIGTLPARQLLPLWAAIFSTFSMLGFLLDLFNRGRQPILLLAINVVLSGVFAIAYARLTFSAPKWSVFAVMAVQIAVTSAAARVFPLLPEPAAGRVMLDALGTLVAVVVGYSLFLNFINSTAARYLQAQAEIAVARDIHRVLVPAIDCRIGRYEFFGRSDASGDVGGDLVDVVDVSGRWLAYVADVSGHGVGPGLVMGLCKSAMRMRARSATGIGQLLEDVHSVLMPLKPPATFVTVACVRGGIDERLECAVAGHLPVLRVRNGCVEEVTQPQFAVGMFDMTTFESQNIDAQPGDLFALLTDGVVEVFDAETRELGLDWAKGVLAAEHEQPLRVIADRLFSSARAHGPQIDDQTLLLIRLGDDA
jgi:serine phosphatase RsbU (regulator of sigma subunit)